MKLSKNQASVWRIFRAGRSICDELLYVSLNSKQAPYRLRPPRAPKTRPLPIAAYPRINPEGEFFDDLCYPLGGEPPPISSGYGREDENEKRGDNRAEQDVASQRTR